MYEKEVGKKIKYLIQDGFLHILVGNSLAKMIAFISSIVIVRLVSKEEYGYLAYADNLYSYITLFSGLGLSTGILKYCSPDISKDKNRAFLKIALRYGTIFQFLVSLFLIIGVLSIGSAFPQAKPLILLLFLYPVLTQILSTFQNYARSQLKNKLFANMGVIQTGIVFLASVILTLIFGIYGVIYARYIAIIIVIIIGFKFVKHDLVGSKRIIIDSTEEKAFWKLSISLMLANLFSMIMPINEMYMINHLIKDASLTASYKVAILIPSQITFITHSIIIYIFPKIAKKSKNRKEAFEYSCKIGFLVFIIIMIICIIGCIISSQIVSLMYGTNYLDDYTLFMSKIYWFVYGINAGFRMIPMNILPALGITFFNSVSSIVSCVAHICLLIIFINMFGILGAAIALLIIYIISGIGYWMYLYYFCCRYNKK